MISPRNDHAYYFAGLAVLPQEPGQKPSKVVTLIADFQKH
jgi:hypothetical protein